LKEKVGSGQWAFYLLRIFIVEEKTCLSNLQEKCFGDDKLRRQQQ